MMIGMLEVLVFHRGVVVHQIFAERVMVAHELADRWWCDEGSKEYDRGECCYRIFMGTCLVPARMNVRGYSLGIPF